MALTESGASNAGEVIISDSTRTQSFFGDVFFPTRRYVTYTFPGTEATIAGTSQWTFQWKAPDSDVGTVAFYCGAVCANNDGTDHGDYAYTISKSLQHAGSSAVRIPYSGVSYPDHTTIDLR